MRSAWGVVFLVGCGQIYGAVGELPGDVVGPGPTEDHVRDGGFNVGSDAGVNAGSDGGLHGGSDGGSNAGSDGGSNAGSDGGSDAGSDGGSNAGSDGGSSGSDAGSDAGAADASVDAGFDIITEHDAGPVLVNTGLPWSWSVVSAVLSTPPSDGGVSARWVDVPSAGVDRAWAGGVLLFDGGVVAIPFNAASVLVIHPSDDTSERWPVSGAVVHEGWLGGVLLPDGTVIAIPHNASHFLRIDSAARTAVPFGPELSDTGADGGLDKFSGGVLGLNGLVYAAPSAASFIARLDPATGVVTRLPVPAPYRAGGTQGAVLFPTGEIAMFPMADTPGLLVIPSRDGGQDEVWLLPRPPVPGAMAFTGGGIITGVDTALAPPQQNALPLQYRKGLLSWAPAVPGLAPPTAANEYFFGAWSTDGHFYAPPYGVQQALRFTGAASELVSLELGSIQFRAVFGAVGLADGRIIAIPHDRASWLELTPEGRVPAPMEAMTSPFLNKL